MRLKRILVVSQVYPPDPASVGQHIADAAEALVLRGWEVTVLTANRGYDDPGIRYVSELNRNGVRVIRLPLSSLGKKTILHRVIGQLSFCIQAILRGLFFSKLDASFVTTSPPMGSIVAVVLGVFRQIAIHFWVMDINPDQAIVSGKVGRRSVGVWAMNWLNRCILKRANLILVLDRFMMETMRKKFPLAGNKFKLLPPWPMEGHLRRIEHADNPFRKEHGLEGKFVVMYSGNHSPVHPLDTVLQAALRLQDESRLQFLFVGGGLGKRDVEQVISEQRPMNIRSLPYQPLDRIQYSLSAADLHIVSIGDPMVGLIHPCKFYGAMALSKPFVLIGQRESHIGDVLAQYECGWQFKHGDVDGLVNLLLKLVNASDEDLEVFGARGRSSVEDMFGKERLCNELCEVIELETFTNRND